MAIPQAAIAAMGGIGQLLGALGLGNNEAEWNQNALVTLWNRAQQGDEMARALWGIMADPARQGALDQSAALSRLTIDQAPWLYEAMTNLAGGIPGEIDNSLAKAYTPEMQAANAGLLGGVDRNNQIGDLASQLFAGGGWTPQSQELFDTLSAYMNGRGSNAQLALGDVGPTLISQRGQTAYTQGMQDRATDASQTRGLSPDLQFAIDRAKDSLATGGASANTEWQAGAGRQLFADAAGKAVGDSLQSPDVAANWSREEAANAYASQMEAARRAAQARGAAPGVILGAGQQDNFLAEYADKALRAQTEAARKGFSDQESKWLQDKGIAAGLASQAGNMVGSADQNEISRLGQAYSAIPGTSNAATAFMSALLGSGDAASQNEVSRMNAGTNMAQTLLGSQNAAASQYGSTLANQNQYALGGGALGLNASGQNASAYNQNFGNQLGAGQLGNALAGTQLGAQNNAYNNAANLWASFLQGNQGALNTLTNLAGQGMGYAQSYVNLMGAPFSRLQGGTAQQGTPWGAIGAGLGGLLGGLGRPAPGMGNT